MIWGGLLERNRTHQIKELAIYEKDPDAAKATPELIQINVFERKYAHAILAEQNEKPLGMALVRLLFFSSFLLAFFSFSTCLSSCHPLLFSLLHQMAASLCFAKFRFAKPS